MKIFLTSTAAALFLLPSLALSGLAQTGSAAALPGGKIVLPEGTEIKLTLEKSLKSGAEKVGEEVPYEVARDVYTPFPAHILLIPSGTPAFGKVTRSSRRGMLGKGGKLEFTCDYVRALDGTHVALRSDKAIASGRSNAGANVAAALLLAPGYLLINGRDISVEKGKEMTAFVDQETLLSDPHAALSAASASAPLSALPQAPTASSLSLFTLKNGSQIVGTLASFDGTNYLVATPAGTQSLRVDSVASMHALAAAPPAATLAPAPSVPAAPIAPRLPLITTFPQHVRLETQDGNSYFGDVTAFDGTSYSITTKNGTLTIRQADVKALELLKPN